MGRSIAEWRRRILLFFMVSGNHIFRASTKKKIFATFGDHTDENTEKAFQTLIDDNIIIISKSKDKKFYTVDFDKIPEIRRIIIDEIDEEKFEMILEKNHTDALKNAIDIPLDAKWLTKQIDHLNKTLMPLSYGATEGSLIICAHDIAKSSFQVLAGPLDNIIRFFLFNSALSDLTIPSTAPKIGFNFKHEPCGNVRSRHNLMPEWLRHFSGIFYDKKEFQARIGRKFFPFENRDHLVHTILVALLGNLIFGIEITDKIKKQVLDDIGDDSNVKDVKNLFDLMSKVYQKRFGESDVEINPWLKAAWAAVAFWHDSGYDATTWYLLTTREFSHSCLLSDLSINKKIWAVFHNLYQIFRGEKLMEHLEEFLTQFKPKNRTLKSTPDDPYHFFWFVEGCHIEKSNERHWGRFHALLSADEFLYHFGKLGNIDKKINHLAIAIAEHHEPKLDPTRDPNDIINEFIRNPIGLLLSFSDALAATQRVKLDWSNIPVLMDMGGNKGNLSFTMDLNSSPLWIVPSEKDGSRCLDFLRGYKHFHNKLVGKTFWGQILKEVKPKYNTESKYTRKKNQCKLDTYGRKCAD